MYLANSCQYVLWAFWGSGQVEPWHLQGFAREWSPLAGWVTKDATGTQAILEAPRAGLAPIFISAAILTLKLYQHSHLPVLTLSLVSGKSGSSSLLTSISSSRLCSKVFGIVEICCYGYSGTTDCTGQLGRALDKVFGTECSLMLINLRPGIWVWTHYLGDNVFFVFPYTWDLEKHENIALMWAQEMTVAPAENSSQPICSGNCPKAAGLWVHRWKEDAQSWGGAEPKEGWLQRAAGQGKGLERGSGSSGGRSGPPGQSHSWHWHSQGMKMQGAARMTCWGLQPWF